MAAIRTLLQRTVALFGRTTADRERDEEIRIHLDLLAADYERRGLSPADARLAAVSRLEASSR